MVISRNTWVKINISRTWGVHIPLFFLLLVWPFLSQTDEYLDGITAQMVFYAVLCCGCVGKFLRRESFRIKMADLLLGVFVTWYGFRILASDLPIDQWMILTGGAGGLLYFWVRNTKEYRLFFCMLLLGGLIQVCWYLLQRGGIFASYNSNFEGTGSFHNPALLSLFLSIALLGGLYCRRLMSSCFFRWLIGGLMVVMAGCLLLLSSRASWIGLLFGLVWLVWTGYKNSLCDILCLWLRKKRFIVGIAWILSIVSVLGIVFYGLYALRPESVGGRLLIWRITADLWQEAPWLGEYSFQSRYMLEQAAWFAQYRDSTSFLTADNVHFAFSEPLRIASEIGVIGLGLFLLLAGYIFMKVSNGNREARYGGAMLVVLFVFGLFGYPFSIEWFVFIILCLLALAVNETDGQVLMILRLKRLRYIAILCVVSFGVFCGVVYCQGKRADLLLQLAQGKPEFLFSGGCERFIPSLAGNPSFMLCYARTLYNHGYYPQALPVMEQAFSLRPSSHLVCDWGVCLEETGAYEEAEAAYLLAARMVPGHILPRFRLFELYRKRNQWDKAAVVARELVDKPVKVVNTTVLKVRHQARQFLQEQFHSTNP